MPAPTGSSNYDIAYYELTNTESELNRAKNEFEIAFQRFLCRFRPYSSVGRNLTEPIFDIRNISELIKN
jgi:hypothetical protein